MNDAVITVWGKNKKTYRASKGSFRGHIVLAWVHELAEYASRIEITVYGVTWEWVRH